MDSPARLKAYLSAGAISILTLYVFSRLQEYGPESAIRRFHTAIFYNDPQELQRVSVEPIRSRSVISLAGQVRGMLLQGATIQLSRMERTPDQVRAAVVYRNPKGEVFPMIWIVERSGRTWRVNAEKTVTVLYDSLGL